MQGRRLAILLHTVVAPAGGGWMVKNRVGDLIEEIADHGWQIIVLARGQAEPQPFMTHRLSDRIRVIALPERPAQALRQLRRVGRVLRQADAGIVFMPLLSAALAGLTLGRRGIVYAGHAWAHLPQGNRRREYLEALLARRSALVVAAGDALVNRFLEAGADAIPCVPLVHPDVAARLRAEEPEPKRYDAVRLLYVGSLSAIKGTPELIDVLRACPGVECRAVGPFASGEGAVSLQRQLEELPNVQVEGYLDWPELRRRYEWATVLLLPSHTEGFPRVVYEATAFGLGLVVTPVGGIPDRLVDGRDGRIVAIGDVAAMVAAIRSLADDPGSIARFNESARATLRPVFSDASPGPQFDRILTEVVAGRQ